jgi:hypothetical protein
MGLFDKAATEEQAPAASTGAISFTKGDKISLTKTSLVKVIARWSSNTDYDLLADVMYADGHCETVSMFGTVDNPTYQTHTRDGAVSHLGDVGRSAGRSGTAEEVIEIRLNPNIVAVVPYAYSAQSNGTGSFRKYKVSLEVNNGAGDIVVITSANASRNSLVYTCVPAIIRQQGQEVVIDGVELYSRMTSENRPKVNPDGTVVMNAGPRNVYK